MKSSSWNREVCTHRTRGFRALPPWPKVLFPHNPVTSGWVWRQDVNNVFLTPFRTFHLPNKTTHHDALCGNIWRVQTKAEICLHKLIFVTENSNFDFVKIDSWLNTLLKKLNFIHICKLSLSFNQTDDQSLLKCKLCTLILCTLSFLTNSSSLFLISIWWRRCETAGQISISNHVRGITN